MERDVRASEISVATKVARDWPFGEVDVERKIFCIKREDKVYVQGVVSDVEEDGVEKKLTMPAKIEGRRR